jgi:hypothetical protein
MFFPPLCIEAFGFCCHKAPFVGRVKNAFEGNQILISILTVSTLGVNEFLNPDVSWLNMGRSFALIISGLTQSAYKKELST